MDRLKYFRQFEGISQDPVIPDYFIMLGSAGYCLGGKNPDEEFQLSINPKYQMLQLINPDGNGKWCWISEMQSMLDELTIAGEDQVVDWIVKYVNEADFYYQSFVVDAERYKVQNETLELDTYDGAVTLEFYGGDGEYIIQAYPDNMLFKLIMPDTKFIWSSYDGLTANKEFFQSFDNGNLYKYLKQTLGVTDTQPFNPNTWNTFESISHEMEEKHRGGVHAYRMEINIGQPYSIVIDPKKDIICTYYPARCVPTQAARFYKDNTGLIGLHSGEVEKWFLQKIADAGGNVDDVIQGRRDVEVIKIPRHEIVDVTDFTENNKSNGKADKKV
jgi:hypothetical protein